MVIRKLTSVWSCKRFSCRDLFSFLLTFGQLFDIFGASFRHLLHQRTCNSAAKHQFYIECEITCTGWYERATSQCVTKLRGKNTCGRLVFVSNRSDADKPFQTAPAHQFCILEGWYVLNRAPLWPLHTTSIIVSRRRSRRILSKNSLAVQAQFVFGTIYNVWKGRRKREAKFKD